MAKAKIKAAATKVAKADRKVAKAARSERQAAPIRALSLVAKLGDQPPLRSASTGLLIAGLLLRHGRMIRAGIRMLLAHELATAAKDVIKERIDRTRPHSARGTSEATPTPGRKTAKKHTSFPSGHSAGAVAVAQAYAREFPDHRLAALAAATTIAGGQVARRAHYPTDVAAGMLLGAAVEAAVAVLWSKSEDYIAATS